MATVVKVESKKKNNLVSWSEVPLHSFAIRTTDGRLLYSIRSYTGTTNSHAYKGAVFIGGPYEVPQDLDGTNKIYEILDKVTITYGEN